MFPRFGAIGRWQCVNGSALNFNAICLKPERAPMNDIRENFSSSRTFATSDEQKGNFFPGKRLLSSHDVGYAPTPATSDGRYPRI
jgi:hypothetical protein